jgi:hypothetical protein
MNAPNPTSIEPLAQRGLRFAALGLQAVLVTLLLLLLGLAAWPTPVYNQLQVMFGIQYGPPPSVPSWILFFGLGLALILVALGVFLASWRLQVRSWWRIALGYVALGVVLAYLAHDEAAIRHPLTMEEISPVFPGAEASFNVLMRYGKAHPLAQNFKALGFKNPYPSLNPDAPGPWRETITARRAEFEAHWAELAPVRAWWAELNAFDRIGDLTPARVDAEIISFQVFRTMSQHGVAIASLQALDGRGDDAIDTLLPILQVGRKLQPYSRTLVRAMVGVVIERMSLKTAAFILDNSAVSPAARARLAAALQGGDPEAGARHLLSTEYALQLGAVGGKRLGELWAECGSRGMHPWLQRAFNAVSPFIYNPRATLNLDGDLYVDLQDLVGRRQLEQMDPRMKKFEQDVRPTFKNLFGKLLVSTVVPTYSKVSQSYWTNQDMRAALLARVTKP